MFINKRIFVVLFLAFIVQSVSAKYVLLTDSLKTKIETFLTEEVRKKTSVPRIKIDSVFETKSELKIFASVPLSYPIFEDNDITRIYDGVWNLLPSQSPGIKKKQQLKIYSDGYLLQEYVPGKRKERFENKVSKPLVSNISRINQITKGLENRHLAIWQSHGRYYNQKERRWKWQRARMFQTVEDLYTQSYVLPYLVPMLENAGANVLIPRERDTQKYEIIIDSDKSSEGSTTTNRDGKEMWQKGTEKGFAHLKPYYVDGENPFNTGTYKEVKTIKNGDASTFTWIPNMPEKGRYAVYVSYKSLKNSTDDASYTVYHLGGKTEFKVNQQMGGGTWIYLGTFAFDKGYNEGFKIELSNLSSKNGKIVTADAVKIGGGMGLIARQPNEDGAIENVKSSDAAQGGEVRNNTIVGLNPETSGYPKYTEASRYWLQWAGMPDSVYSKTEWKNDYTDDYQSRAFWVNHIAGGSSVIPKKEGLNIPVDLAFAFHTDAGTTFNDSIIGTLGICMTHHNDEKFASKKPRILSRDLTQYIMEEIERDVRTLYEPNWTTRHIWNRSYAEARIPEVPTMLLELLSHQNFADMKYGLDPRFQFDVSRAIYKGMLRFVSEQYKQEYVVQPLPVNTFSLDFEGETKIKLAWQPTIDKLEESATPMAYIVYTRQGDADFDNGKLVKGNSIVLDIQKDQVYSYKITAVNDGGESFPSEILSVCRKTNEKGNVLVVNGFDRLSAPHSFQTVDSIGGFVDALDHGVPHINQYNYIGSQKEFRRKLPWLDDDSSGFGDSYSDYETTVVAGNAFDYPYQHGLSIAEHGYSFISASRDAVISGQIDMNNFRLVDLILGKQKQTKIGRGVFGYEFKTFPSELQSKIRAYCKQGGSIFVSGSFVATDLWDSDEVKKEDQDFAQQVLKYKWRTGQASKAGDVKTVASPFKHFEGNYTFYNKPNEMVYGVESPDGIEPADDTAYTFMRYIENGLSAGVVSATNYKTIVLGFPFETIKTAEERNALMKSILNFIFEK